jgi:hypothetical protein
MEFQSCKAKKMGYEVDFLPVGNESTGGDAIALIPDPRVIG